MIEETGQRVTGGLRQEVRRAVQQRFKRVDLDRFKVELKDHMTHYLFEQTQRSPIVIPVVNVIGGKAESAKTVHQSKTKSAEEVAADQTAALPADARTPADPGRPRRLENVGTKIGFYSLVARCRLRTGCKQFIDQAKGDPERLHLLVRQANARYDLEQAAGKVSDDEYIRLRAALEYAKDELTNHDYPGEVPDIVE